MYITLWPNRSSIGWCTGWMFTHHLANWETLRIEQNMWVHETIEKGVEFQFSTCIQINSNYRMRESNRQKVREGRACAHSSPAESITLHRGKWLLRNTQMRKPKVQQGRENARVILEELCEPKHSRAKARKRGADYRQPFSQKHHRRDCTQTLWGMPNMQGMRSSEWGNPNRSRTRSTWASRKQRQNQSNWSLPVHTNNVRQLTP